VGLNQLQVLPGDIVIILFHLSERVLMVLHQLVDVLVFALFNLVYFNFLPQLKLSLELLVLILIRLDVCRLFDFECHGQVI